MSETLLDRLDNVELERSMFERQICDGRLIDFALLIGNERAKTEHGAGTRDVEFDNLCDERVVHFEQVGGGDVRFFDFHVFGIEERHRDSSLVAATTSDVVTRHFGEMLACDGGGVLRMKTVRCGELLECMCGCGNGKDLVDGNVDRNHVQTGVGEHQAGVHHLGGQSSAYGA